jgi:hypothetical protein
MKKISLFFVLCAVVMLVGCGGPEPAVTQEREAATAPTGALSPEEAKAIAKEAYIYGFSQVMNYKTMYMYVVDEKSPEYKGPFNSVGCEARLFTPDDKAVVTPNSDTPYCMFWIDLRREPLVLTVPEMEPNRFYHVQLIDLYTHNYAYVGTLTSGNEAGAFLLAGPGWAGEKPEGITEVITSETDFVFSVIRTQLFNEEDMDRVKEMQDSYNLQPLSAYLGKEPPPAPPTIEFPEWREGGQFNAGFFDFFDFMLSLIKPVDEEKELMRRFARIGLGADQKFDMAKLSPEIREALEEGLKEGFKELEAFMKQAPADPLASAKIFGTREFLKASATKNYSHSDFYLMRAVAAHMGLYGNSGAEAIYPTYLVDSEGEPINAAENNYTITFAEKELPPVKAFWSLSMYDGQTQLFIHNPLDRYLLNSTTMDQFAREADGSIVLYVQKESPGEDKEANWLPAPDGPLYMVLRLYGPESEALEGKWTPPTLQRVK